MYRDKIMSNSLDSILGVNAPAEDSGMKFYQMMRGENLEHYVEFRFRDGIRTAFAYDKLSWFNFSPEGSMLDLNFMGTMVSIEGRGLDDFFTALKARKISWVKEAETEWQDNNANTIFVKEITILPPKEDFEDVADERINRIQK